MTAAVGGGRVQTRLYTHKHTHTGWIAPHVYTAAWAAPADLKGNQPAALDPTHHFGLTWVRRSGCVALKKGVSSRRSDILSVC